MHFSFGSPSLPDKILCFSVPALFFATPLSSSAKSILIGITLISVLLSQTCRLALKDVIATRWFRAVAILFGVALIGCLWSPATWSEKGLVLEKWSKLITLPLLVVAFQQVKTRQWALKAFVLAMCLTCLVGLLMQWTGWFHTNMKTPEGVFRNHIMTSMMMAFATYVALWLFNQEAGKQRFFYAMLALLFSYHILFINQSRSGYVCYLLLMSTLIFQSFNRHRAWLMLIGFGICCSCACYLSQSIQNSVRQAIQNVQHYEQDGNTSVGYRMQFHQFARQLFHEHPIIGHGTGSFTYLFRTENPVPAWTNDPSHSGRLLEPHSQYWLVAAELGIIGLGAMALFYAELFLIAARLPTLRSLNMALLFIFTVGNLSDSLLFYSGSGYFFLLFFALCLSESSEEVRLAKPIIPQPTIHHVSV